MFEKLTQETGAEGAKKINTVGVRYTQRSLATLKVPQTGDFATLSFSNA